MIEERDIPVVMRDGTRLVLDVYRPDAAGRYPVLYACSLHNKDIQGPDIADVLPPQPAHAPLWFGPIEAGNTRHFIANGYVHVIAQPRGSAKSEGQYGHEDTDHYDIIEWITRQPWCDGNVGMVGISGLDFKQYINLYNILTQKGQRTFLMYHLLTSPWEADGVVERSEEAFKKIKIPFYTGSGAYAYTYKLHWLGAQHYFQNIEQPKKLIFTGPAHLERPFHQYHDEIIRWYDHWLKGRDTGIMDEPPVRYWLMGANEWRSASDWPLPETEWTKFYLAQWEGLTTDAPLGSEAGASVREPDVFTQMPLTRTVKVERLRYMTDPLPHDVDVVGPIALTLYAAIDQNDTNWIVVLKDVGPDVSVRTAREGERAVPQNLPERELTRGWLKASYRAVDEKRSKPWEPFHKLTRAAVAPVVPGEIVEYRIQILGTANRFKAGHRICLDITSMDVPTGTGAMTNVEYIPYHVCSSQTVSHRIYRDAERPSHLLLPIIPDRG
jgi:uncharacterized protein